MSNPHLEDRPLLAGPSFRQVSFELTPVPPFRLDLSAWVLRRRSSNVVDRWDGVAYRRVLALQGQPAEVSVVQTDPPDSPRLWISVSGKVLPPAAQSEVTTALDCLLGIHRDLRDFYRFSASDPMLQGLVRPFRGVKPPRFPTVFEALVNAIACQQVSLNLGILLLNRLAQNYGLAFERKGGPAYAFPLAEQVAPLEPIELRNLGFSLQKGRALIELARALVAKRLDLEALTSMDDITAVSHLRQLRGVGRWTAEYALLRGLGRLHVFPGDDVGARKNLQRWLNLTGPLDYQGVGQILSKWQGYGGLIYFHLLLKRLAQLELLREREKVD